MLKAVGALAVIVSMTAACAHTGDAPTMRASHAPGGTGLGSGTMGAETFSGAGSVR